MIVFPTTLKEDILALVSLRSRQEAIDLIDSEGPNLFSSEEPESDTLRELLISLLQAKRYEEFLSRYSNQDIQNKILRLLHKHESSPPWQDLSRLWTEYSKPEASHKQDHSLFASSDEIRAELSSLEQRIYGPD